jgi:hypothetical protein
MKTELTYFNRSGKFYSIGLLEHKETDFYDLRDLITKMREQQRLPDIPQGHSIFFIVMFTFNDVPCLVL